MKKQLQSAFVIAMLSAGAVSAQKFQWAAMVNAPGTAGTYGLVADTAGNTIAVGQYQGTGSTFGSFDLSSVAGTMDVFIEKLNSSGTVLWAQSAGGSGSDNANAVVLDALGNSYVVGTIGDTATFGSHVLNYNGGGFIAMYNSTGVCQWATYIPAGYVRKVVLDGSDNLYVTGNYTGTMTIASNTLTSVGSEDIFVAKYNNTGTALWAVSMGGPNDEGAGIGSLTVDKSGNVYVANDITGHGMVGTLKVVAKGTDSLAIFVAKYGTNGNFIWAKQADDSTSWANDITWSKKMNALYITGSLTGGASFGTVKIGPATTTYYNPYVVEMDTAGTFGWGLVGTCTSWAKGSAVTTDTAGNVYATGYQYGTIDLGGAGNLALASGAGFDANILKANAEGVWQWGKVTGNDEFVYNDGIAISTDKAGNVYQGARMYGSSTFDGHALSAGFSLCEAYVCQLNPAVSTAGISENTLFADVSIYPNPVSGNLNIHINTSEIQTVLVQVLSVNGQLVYGEKLNVAAGENSTSITTDTYAKGLYFIQLITEKGSVTKKVVVE